MINNKIFIFIGLFIVIVSFLLIPVISGSDGWSVRLNSEINLVNSSSVSSFVAGYDFISNDGLDRFDVEVIETQQYSTLMYSIIDGKYLIVDYKSSPTSNQEKVWDIAQKSSEEFKDMSNLNEQITWKFYNIPDEVSLKLVDYGDSSSRSSVVREIDLKEKSSYKFQFSNPAGEYRYFRIIAKYSKNQNIQDDVNYIASENISSQDNIKSNNEINSISQNEYSSGTIFLSRSTTSKDVPQGIDRDKVITLNNFQSNPLPDLLGGDVIILGIIEILIILISFLIIVIVYRYYSMH